jgi:SAM-dependent methyltransferase
MNALHRTSCRGCDSPRLETIFDFGEMPLAGGFLAGPEAIATEQCFPLQVHVCRDCALVQILDAIPHDILFGDYAFSSSTVPPLVEHFRQYAAWLAERFAPKTVVEFGCNDGILLAPLQEAGIRAVGVDLAPNITEIARANGLDAVTGSFDVPTAEALVDRIGTAEVVTGSNAFAHNDHPEEILDAARTMLAPGGRLCLEVMYAGDLLEQLQWDTLYHEHLTFYSLSSLSKLLEKHGFFVEHAERLPMHGGSLRVVAVLDRDVTPSAECDAVMAYEREARLDVADTWVQFGQRISRKIHIVRTVFDSLKADHNIWAYGAAGKATMWVNACQMNFLGGMVDASPLRAGKLMPGTHTPIVFPDQFKEAAPDVVFITAWNYAAGISAKEPWYQGLWAVPLPDLRFF